MKVQVVGPLLVGALMCACTGQVADPSPTVSQTSSPKATAATSLSPTPSLTASPSPPARAFQRHEIAQVVTNDLVVRSAPGTGPDSEIHPTLISSPTLLYVFDGPVRVDGYDWYQVLPATYSYEPSGLAVGWVASASKEGEAWIGEPELDCPRPNLEGIAASSDVARLACFGGRSLALEGQILGCLDRDPAVSPALIWSERCMLQRFDCCPDVTPFPAGIAMWFDGDIGPTEYARPLPVSVDGHLDDPGAARCPDVAGGEGWTDARLEWSRAEPPAGWGVFLCRVEFVATRTRSISP